MGILEFPLLFGCILFLRLAFVRISAATARMRFWLMGSM